jgi:hypothetical protein
MLFGHIAKTGIPDFLRTKLVVLLTISPLKALRSCVVRAMRSMLYVLAYVIIDSSIVPLTVTHSTSSPFSRQFSAISSRYSHAFSSDLVSCVDSLGSISVFPRPARTLGKTITLSSTILLWKRSAIAITRGKIASLNLEPSKQTRMLSNTALESLENYMPILASWASRRCQETYFSRQESIKNCWLALISR